MVARGEPAAAWPRMAGADGLALAAAADECTQRGRAAARGRQSPTNPLSDDVNSPAALGLLIFASSMQKMHCAHVICPYALCLIRRLRSSEAADTVLIGRVDQGRRG